MFQAKGAEHMQQLAKTEKLGFWNKMLYPSLTDNILYVFFVFLKMGQSRPLFVYFRVTISIQIEKSIDGLLGIRTRGRRMVGADKTTELWRPPYFRPSFFLALKYILYVHVAYIQMSSLSLSDYLPYDEIFQELTSNVEKLFIILFGHQPLV